MKVHQIKTIDSIEDDNIRAKDFSPLHCSLLLFFAGWGMDEHPFKEYIGSDYDLFICYDYSDLSFESELLKPYNRIKVVAWSMGVWAASQILQRVKLPIVESIALNGTLFPVDDEQGIPTSIFEGTLTGLNEQTLKKFQRRMCGSSERLNAFLEKAPQRSIESLKNELRMIGEMAVQCPVPVFEWDKIYIGEQDKIFSFRNQVNAWRGKNILIVGEEHYPGDSFWKENFSFPIVKRSDYGGE